MTRLSLIVLLVLASGCASITDRHQYVRVVTESPETKIYYGDELKGVGQSTLYISRSRNPQIALENKEKKEIVDLKTSYRWGHSFGGNALLFGYAPFGWLIDFLTGAAWEAKDVVSQKRELLLGPQSKLLVLPPTGVDEFESRELAKEIEKWFHKNEPKINVLPFEQTYYTSVGLGFDHDSAKIKDDTSSYAELLHRTQATHLVFSEYMEASNAISVWIMSPYTEKLVRHLMVPEVSLNQKQSIVGWLFEEAFEISPNTISVGTLETRYGGCAYNDTDPFSRYCATQPKRGPFSFLSSISLTNVLHYRKRETWGLYFRLYPDFNFSFNEVEFYKASPSLPSLNADWVFMSMGYGPRLSFIVPVGELFIEFTPFWAMNYLKIYSDSFSHTRWKGSLGFTTQLGLHSWISSHWNLRLFAKATSQNLGSINLGNIDPGTHFFGSLFVVQSGISVGYYFHEEKVKILDWSGLAKD